MSNDIQVAGIQRLILLNQVTGPLFQELAEGLASRYPEGVLLVTGRMAEQNPSPPAESRLVFQSAPVYDRRSRARRVWSWLRYTAATTRYALFARRHDAILLVSNPPLLGPWIWLLSRLRGLRYSVLVYDIHPDVLVRLGVLNGRGWLAWIWRNVNRRVYQRACAVITIGHRMASSLQNQIGPDDPQVAVVPPWVDVKLIRPLGRDENPFADAYSPQGPVVVLYSGNMGASHDIDSILEAAWRLRAEHDVFFLLIGEGEKYPDALAFAERHKLDNLRVFPFQPEDRLPYTLPLGDIALVALDEGMEDLMVPSKAFFYLAAGSALVAIANEKSELSDLLDQAEVGVRVAPRDPIALAESIRSLARDPKRLGTMRIQARRLAEEHYSRERGVAAFSSLLEQVGLGPSRSVERLDP